MFSGLNGGPRDMSTPYSVEPVIIILYGKRMNISLYGKGAIKIKLLREGIYPELFRWAANAIACILIAERRSCED